MRRLATALLLAMAMLGACDVPGVTVMQQPSDVPRGPTGFEMAVTLEDSDLAAALGWTDGVPGATVVIHRFIDPFQPETLVTDATGRASLLFLLPGWYAVAGHRVLTEDETGPTGGVVRAFGDGLKRNLSGTATVQLQLRLDEPGSLVFTERYTGGSTIDIQYNGWDSFFELYNNSDTTVYVDRMVIGRAFSWVGSGSPCEDWRAYRDDPMGIWSLQFHQFPGSGTDYPVASRQVVTIALDAADHSQVHASLPDLSRADFEFEGTADTDNPDVPNLPAPPPSQVDAHGMIMISIAAYFLTSPVDVSTLETQTIGPFQYARFPSNGILDVFSADDARPNAQPPFVRDDYCTWINREFDRLEAFFYYLEADNLDADNRTSIHRRILRDAAGGSVLQDINTSFTDWVLGIYSPGRIEY